MRIVGLDLSLTSTGIALPDGSVQRIKPPKGQDRGMERLDYIRDQIVYDLLDLFLTEDVVLMIEGYAHGRSYQAHFLGELGGVVRHSLWKNGYPYIDVTPPSLKMFATGIGNASKDAVLAEAIRRLDYQGSSNDESDALWLRQLGMHLYGIGEIDLPKRHLRALEKIEKA